MFGKRGWLNAGTGTCWKAVGVAVPKLTPKCGRTERQEGKQQKQSGHVRAGGEQGDGMPSERGLRRALCHFMLPWYSRNRTALLALSRSSLEDLTPHLLLIHRPMHETARTCSESSRALPGVRLRWRTITSSLHLASVFLWGFLVPQEAVALHWLNTARCSEEYSALTHHFCRLVGTGSFFSCHPKTVPEEGVAQCCRLDRRCQVR